MARWTRKIIGGVVVSLLCTALAGGSSPNIVLILADDIGYGDLSCYGATAFQTPHLDSLAEDGVLFTNAHSPASTCTPSRRALMTGVYSWRQEAGSSIMRGNSSLSIEPGRPTLPSVLKTAGYHTALVGKWHLGLGPDGGPDWNGNIKPGPLELGFDYAFYLPGTNDRTPCVYIENHRVVGLDADDPIRVDYDNKVGDEPTGKENPDGMTKLKSLYGHDNTIVNGIGRIGWMTGGKTARWKDEDMCDVFTTQALTYLDEHADRPFFLFYSPHNIHVPRLPHPRFQGQSGHGFRCDAILELDDSVGQLLAKLDELKLREKTLVVFTSDNGGVLNDGYNDFEKTDHSMNGVLRGRKGLVYEGGHRVPFLVRWPGVVKPDTRSDELLTYMDFIASFAALTGQSLDDAKHLDAINMLPVLRGEKPERPLRSTFIAHRGGTNPPFSIQKGDWKLVRLRQNPNDSSTTQVLQRDELYNLADDLSEKSNLAESNPEKLKELQRALEAEISKTKNQ